MSQEPAPPPDVEWVKVSGPDALAPLDRHWIRLLRVALLAAAVLIAWRILAWQEDSYQLAAAGAPAAQTNAGSMVTAPPIPETPVPTAVPGVVISPTPTPTIAPTPTPTLPPTPTPKTHTVRPGEYLSVIAGFYGVSMSAIIELNNIPNPDDRAGWAGADPAAGGGSARRGRASGDVYRAARRNAEHDCRGAGRDG